MCVCVSEVYNSPTEWRAQQRGCQLRLLAAAGVFVGVAKSRGMFVIWVGRISSGFARERYTALEKTLWRFAAINKSTHLHTYMYAIYISHAA